MTKPILTSTTYLVKQSSEGKIIQICLAMKKRGHGEGNWNGAGGKLEVGETFRKGAIREAKEEFGVGLTELQNVAYLKFPESKGGPFMHTAIYLAYEWNGEPTETEEMQPKWFSIDDIPYNKMWDSDRIWLPKILSGEKFEVTFVYDDNVKIVEEKTLFSEFKEVE